MTAMTIVDSVHAKQERYAAKRLVKVVKVAKEKE